MNPRRMPESGFTLIEIIIVIVVAAILGTILVTYSGTSLTSSADAIQSVQSANDLHTIMERITADYQGFPRWKPITAYTTSDRVTPLKRNGYFYQPSTNCTSAVAEPNTWNTTDGSDSAESSGGCTWHLTYSTTAPTNPILLSGLATLRQKIAGGSGVTGGGENTTVYYDGDVSTGMQYKIVYNRYINPAVSWDSDNGSATSYLKVAIQSVSGGETLTVIFTQ